MALQRVCDKTGKALGQHEGVIVEAKVVHFAPKMAGQAGYLAANALLGAAGVNREVHETKLDFASLDDLNWDIVQEKLGLVNTQTRPHIAFGDICPGNELGSPNHIDNPKLVLLFQVKFSRPIFGQYENAYGVMAKDMEDIDVLELKQLRGYLDTCEEYKQLEALKETAFLGRMDELLQDLERLDPDCKAEYLIFRSGPGKATVSTCTTEVHDGDAHEECGHAKVTDFGVTFALN